MAIRRPIIPTEIVVHLGAPDEAAKNITVSFQEYIKNVASGEIFPTWPEDAMKSNILAQISFALNRIYNEWYRAKGYDFDITSSPVYDQSFQENRQFFERTSQIVDEIFNNYIVKDEQVQPFFAQYCDGKNTTCDGLSQWGTVTLASQGKSPIEILRNYYGDNIKIIYNTPVEENIGTYPGFPIKLGTTGDYVRTIKMQLNRIGQNYPALPIITNNDIFYTIETQNAVKKFQEIFDLPVTGTVDKSTWYKIKYLYNAVKNISSIYSEGISADEATVLFKDKIELGDSGPAALRLNYLLSVIAYFDNDIPFLKLDSDIVTEKTIQMLKAFQNKYNLDATGIVNRATWVALLEAYEQTLRTIPKEFLQNLNEFYPGYDLSKGMTGDDVINLQEFLYLICEREHKIPGVKITGVFGDLTEQSVKALQKEFGLEQNGIVGPITWDKIVNKALKS